MNAGHPGLPAPEGLAGVPAAGGAEQGGQAEGWRRTFSSLRDNRDFALLFASTSGFFFGMQMSMILSGWIVVEYWDNAAYLGYIMASAALPILVLAPVAGVVSDRVDRRMLLLSTQAVLVLTSGLVALLIAIGAIQFWHLMLITPISGAAFAFNIPGRQALVAVLVPRQQLMNAVALSSASMNLSRIVAPTVAGLLILPIGIGGAYTVATLCYLGAAVVTMLLPSITPEREQEFTFFRDFADGFRHIKHSQMLTGLLLLATVPMLFAMPFQTLLPVFADEVWNVGSAGFGMLEAASGLGGLAGGIVAANLNGSRRPGAILIGSAIAFSVLLFVIALSPWFGLALALMAALGFASMIFGTVNNTEILLVTPDEVRGRVMSVIMMTFGLMPLGAVPAGIAAESVGAPAVVAVSAVLFGATTLAIFSMLPALRTLDRDAAEEPDGEAPMPAAALPAMTAPVAAGLPGQAAEG